MKQLRSYLAGVLTTLVLFGLVGSAFAVSRQMQATLNYRDIKINLDGKEVIPTDANGNAVEPFIIDGTTYLPVRGIANALGLDVKWDDSTSTAILTTPSSSSSSVAFYSEFPTVPDFGAYAGIDCLNVTSKDGSTMYVYSNSSLSEAMDRHDGLLPGYSALIASLGFKYIGSSNDGDIIFYKKDDISVSIGILSTQYFGIMVTDSSKSNAQTTTQTGPTTGQANALSKAKDYLRVMAFSRSGLIKQLEFEGFSTSEATYGADNCGADWNEQAAKKAQEYLDIMSFSRQGLIDQLIYEGFTQSQAEYGVSAVGY